MLFHHITLFLVPGTFSRSPIIALFDDTLSFRTKKKKENRINKPKHDRQTEEKGNSAPTPLARRYNTSVEDSISLFELDVKKRPTISIYRQSSLFTRTISSQDPLRDVDLIFITSRSLVHTQHPPTVHPPSVSKCGWIRAGNGTRGEIASFFPFECRTVGKGNGKRNKSRKNCKKINKLKNWKNKKIFEKLWGIEVVTNRRKFLPAAERIEHGILKGHNYRERGSR